MTFETMVQILVERENIDQFRFFEDEDVLLTRKDGSVVEGYATKYYHFYTEIIMDYSMETDDIGTEGDDADEESEGIGELHIIPLSSDGEIVIKKKDIADIHRKDSLKSLFNKKQRELLHKIGIKEDSFSNSASQEEVIDRIAVGYCGAMESCSRSLMDLYGDILFRCKAIAPEMVSLEDGWRAEPMHLQELLQKNETKVSHSIYCLKKETASPNQLPVGKYMDAVIDEAEKMYENNRESSANNTLYNLFKPIVNAKLYLNEEKCVYLTLNELYEANLYDMYYPSSGKKIIDLETNYADYLEEEAWKRANNDDLSLAKEYLDAAEKWNPVSARVLLDQAEIMLLMGRQNEFYRRSIKALDVAFRPYDRARCYTNMGMYFSLRRKYREAVICYVIGMNYYVSLKAQMQLKDILALSPESMMDVSYEEAAVFAEEHNFDLAFDYSKIWRLGEIASAYIKKEEYGVAYYYLEILYGMTRDIKVKGKMLYVNKLIEKMQR